MTCPTGSLASAGLRTRGRLAFSAEQGFSPAVGLERLLEGYRTAIAGRSALARGGDIRASRGDGDST